MPLKNRRTQEQFEVRGSELVKITSHTPDEEITAEEQLFNFFEFREMLNQQLAHLPREERQGRIRALYEEYTSNKDAYDQLFNDPALVDQIVNDAEKQHKEHGGKWREPSFIGTMASTMMPAHFGVAGLLLTLVAPAAAQQVSGFFTPHTGQPSAGSDLCSGTLLGCDQGYTTNGTEAFNPTTDSQFSRVLNQALNKADSGAREQLRTCFDAGNLGQLVANARNQPTSSATSGSCTTSSSTWQGWEVDVTVTRVPTDQCPSLQNEIEASINGCKSYAGALLNGAKIAGIVIGSVAGVALIAGGCYYAYNKCCKNGLNTNRETEMTGPSMV